jgi:hypothetical protein
MSAPYITDRESDEAFQRRCYGTPVRDIPKGDKHGECNRAACHNRPAIHWNRVMEKHYCTPCARRINEAAKQTGMEPLCDGFGG